jgi:NAD(P)-dependent dehydrogenase (short-subunit alcohol dehydrogenase family)
MNFDLELTGRRALVTGGTKGVGAAVVAVLRDARVKVITTARSAPKALPEGVHFIAADLSTADGCATLAAAVAEQLGGIAKHPKRALRPLTVERGKCRRWAEVCDEATPQSGSETAARVTGSIGGFERRPVPITNSNTGRRRSAAVADQLSAKVAANTAAALNGAGTSTPSKANSSHTANG